MAGSYGGSTLNFWSPGSALQTAITAPPLPGPKPLRGSSRHTALLLWSFQVLSHPAPNPGTQGHPKTEPVVTHSHSVSHPIYPGCP